jgi:hypothetical protein
MSRNVTRKIRGTTCAEASVMESSSSPESPVVAPRSGFSVVGLMIAIACAVLGIVFVIAVVDMRGGAPAKAPRGPAQEAQESAPAAPAP